MQNIWQMYRCIFNPDRATLNSAHIQHIIDQTKQMLTGCLNFFQIIQNKLCTANMCCCKCSKSNNRIHRRCLRPVRMFSGCKCISQILILFYLMFFFFCHITVRNQNSIQFSIFIISLRYNDYRQPSFIYCLRCKTQRFVFFQTLCHRTHINKFPIGFLKWFCNNLLYQFFQMCFREYVPLLIRLHIF